MNAPTDARLRPSVPYVVLSAAGALVLLAMLVRLVVFMQAPAPLPASAWSVMPWNAFVTRHLCTTAYWKAATEVEATPDVYAVPMHTAVGAAPGGRPTPLFIGPYAVDPYEYPPTFLLLPRLLLLATPTFTQFRLLWMVVTTAVVIAGVAIVARRVDRATGSRSLWLAPLALVPIGVFHVFQGGNAQLFFVVLGMLAMLAFERGRHAAGGLLLGYAIVGKLFPGLLVVYLVARREWRAVAWTAGWAAALTVVAIADMGWAPFGHFLTHMPKLLSGEAFPMLQFPGPSDISLSVPGLALKTHRFGLPQLPFEALKIAGWIFSAVIVWATVRLALRPVAPPLAPLVWLVVLGLATLRSPFLPAYGIFQAAWVASILLALRWTDARLRWLVLALWASLLWMTAGPQTTPLWIIAWVATAQIAAILTLFWLAVRVGRDVSVPAAASAAGR